MQVWTDEAKEDAKVASLQAFNAQREPYRAGEAQWQRVRQPKLAFLRRPDLDAQHQQYVEHRLRLEEAAKTREGHDAYLRHQLIIQQRARAKAVKAATTSVAVTSRGLDFSALESRQETADAADFVVEGRKEFVRFAKPSHQEARSLDKDIWAAEQIQRKAHRQFEQSLQLEQQKMRKHQRIRRRFELLKADNAIKRARVSVPVPVPVPALSRGSMSRSASASAAAFSSPAQSTQLQTRSLDAEVSGLDLSRQSAIAELDGSATQRWLSPASRSPDTSRPQTQQSSRPRSARPVSARTLAMATPKAPRVVPELPADHQDFSGLLLSQTKHAVPLSTRSSRLAAGLRSSRSSPHLARSAGVATREIDFGASFGAGSSMGLSSGFGATVPTLAGDAVDGPDNRDLRTGVSARKAVAAASASSLTRPKTAAAGNRASARAYAQEQARAHAHAAAEIDAFEQRLQQQQQQRQLASAAALALARPVPAASAVQQH